MRQASRFTFPGVEMARLKKFGVIIVAFGILSFCVYFAYQKRFQISSRIWQIKHRGLMSFAGYSIPVPANWYVQNEDGDSVGMLRFDYNLQPTEPSIHPRATIAFMNESPITDIDKWVGIVSSAFRLKETEPAERSMVTADGERFSCVGGKVPPPPIRDVPPVVAWQCRSNGRLEILLTGTEQDMNQSWDILSRIQRTTPH